MEGLTRGPAPSIDLYTIFTAEPFCEEETEGPYWPPMSPNCPRTRIVLG